MWQPSTGSHRKAYGIPTEKIDLEHIVRAYSAMFDFNEKLQKDPFTVHCRKCDRPIQYQDNTDQLKRRFYCDLSVWSSLGNGTGQDSCQIEFTQLDINRMTDTEIGKFFYTTIKDTNEEIWVLDTGSAGGKLYTYTRKATEEERVSFVRRTTKFLRKKK